MRILVFGGSGRAGMALCSAIHRLGWELLAPLHAEVDLLHPSFVSDYVLQSSADAVINCAAISGLEACMEDPLSAHLINAVSPAEMALACRHTGARFLHLSTDYVLNGARPGKKAENARCKPINTYAESKREGELQILESYAHALILRVSWLCGNPARPSFVESMLHRAQRGDSLAAIADKWSLPTHVDDLARAILALLPMPVSGILHLCSGGEPLSWWDCAHIALTAAYQAGKLPTMPLIKRQKLNEIAFFRTPRPRHTSMDNSALLAHGICMPTAVQVLEHIGSRCA